MNEGLIPNRYAKALFKFAQDSGNALQVYEQMRQLCENFVNVKTLQSTIDNPYMPMADKENILLTASGAKKGSDVDKFILMLIKNNRVNYFKSIAMAYQDIYRRANHISKVVITTATELPEQELSKVKSMVEEQEKGKTLEFTHLINPELIGGFTITIDSVRLDASIKNELKKLRLKLLS